MAQPGVKKTSVRPKLKKPPKPAFRRYTNLASAIHMLQTKQITLLNPASWDDKNDAYFMAEYKRIRGLKTLLASCFAECDETYHHWKVFASGSDGVCIEFDKKALLESFDGIAGIKRGSVKYEWIKSVISRDQIDVEELPFLKRKPYQPESEYRVIFCAEKDVGEFRDFPIKANWVRRITLSPWMSEALSKSVRKTLKSIDGCSTLSVERSTLTGNEQWMSVTARAE